MRCVFCNINDIVLENDLALAFYDKYPVNKGNLLNIPKRHVEQYFDLTAQERSAIKGQWVSPPGAVKHYCTGGLTPMSSR
jgi:hypothetical protein